MSLNKELAAPRRRLSADARRQQLLDTAAEILVADGVDAVTMESIAQRAGASKSLAWAYFANVEDVLRSLHERELDGLFQRVEDATDEAHDFEGRMRAAVHAYFEIVAERGALLATLDAALGSRRRGFSRARPPSANAFLRWLAGLIADEFGVPGRRARAYAGIVAGVADLHTRAWVAGTFNRQEVEDSCVSFALAGLRAVAASGPRSV